MACAHAWINMTATADLPHWLRLCNRCGAWQVSRYGIEDWAPANISPTSRPGQTSDQG